MDQKITISAEDEDEKRNGRPPAEIDVTELRELCRIHSTNAEIAAHFHVSTRTIERLKKKPEFAEFFERGRADGKISLRRAQWQNALAGNVTMQIWLGKQELNQRDRFEHTVPPGGFSIRDYLANMSEEEYLELAREARIELPPDPDPEPDPPVAA